MLANTWNIHRVGLALFVRSSGHALPPPPPKRCSPVAWQLAHHGIRLQPGLEVCSCLATILVVPHSADEVIPGIEQQQGGVGAPLPVHQGLHARDATPAAA